MNSSIYLEHLGELVTRVKRSLLWIISGFAVAYVFVGHAVALIEQPLIARLPAGSHLIYTGPFEKFWVYLRLAMVAGVILSGPLLLWEVCAFVAPALKHGEKNRMRWLLISFLGVFGLGAILGYLFVLPAVIDAIFAYGGAGSQEIAQLSLVSYVNAALGILLVSAIVLEIPVIMTHISAWRWVSPQTWSQKRRLAFFINAVFAAIFSPPDIMSMVIMMIPIQVLYEIGILGAKICYNRSREAV